MQLVDPILSVEASCKVYGYEGCPYRFVVGSQIEYVFEYMAYWGDPLARLERLGGPMSVVDVVRENGSDLDEVVAEFRYSNMI